MNRAALAKENMSTNTKDASALKDAKQTLQVLMELSDLLNTGLDEETLVILTQLCEAGVHPEALAKVVLELRRESQALQ